MFELRYNDPDHAAHLVSKHGRDLAAIVMMPYEIDPPVAGYLHCMQALARKAGALFVLDEVRSGFRIALGGAQSYFGLAPDLSAFGKALGNGYCISALAGRACHMRHILKLGLTVTHYRSPDVMAAAVATLEALDRSDVPARLTALGERLMSGLDRTFATSGVPGRAVGFPATPFVRFDAPPTECPRQHGPAFRQGHAGRGRSDVPGPPLVPVRGHDGCGCRRHRHGRGARARRTARHHRPACPIPSRRSLIPSDASNP
ncbi:aminotransferase class III-fold pyridoxal phosphate-dependent enzyme [Ralstonia pseudosolanacearum]|uniref:aminotransferase class III-fold pyridoxal phosphate-dependent enzyme n=1 Tax=Ralstonia pseudosolanacearum TaxID=1310165 RepID=UPI0026773B0F|nr:aminotransferase class III-fold pyridoxal phosphate-dependent enzyme [Ralstonia pseudosolanacearum]MDO3561539.1 aminotransferase class III-fold pyridoxal phosphate-dependent enzyme [Ralstonia pseudosolanacearum]MDO3571663.1 aminotransferase class III-fold pyridoxal phosphate-dependent enzyme [Ralstonia pseudosolanacearum]